MTQCATKQSENSNKTSKASIKNPKMLKMVRDLSQSSASLKSRSNSRERSSSYQKKRKSNSLRSRSRDNSESYMNIV